MPIRAEWDAAPREVRWVVQLVVASAIVGTLLELGSLAFDPSPKLAVGLVLGLAIDALWIWLATRLVARRRWAWIVEWWITALSVFGSVLSIAAGFGLAGSILALVFELPMLVLLSRASIRLWVPPPRSRQSLERVPPPFVQPVAGTAQPQQSQPTPLPAVNASSAAAPPTPELPSLGEPTASSSPWGRLPSASALALLVGQGESIASIAARDGVPEEVVRVKLTVSR